MDFRENYKKYIKLSAIICQNELTIILMKLFGVIFEKEKIKADKIFFNSN